MIAGTRTVLYFGRIGLGEFCYGTGTADASKHGTIGLNNEQFCYDPTSNDKGQHGYPYRYQIWAYDLNDFAAVKAGTKQPWEIVPYGVWPLALPTPEPTATKLGGVGYDAATQTLYVSQLYADKGGLSYRPIIHVMRVNATPGSNDDTAEHLAGEQPDPPRDLEGHDVGESHLSAGHGHTDHVHCVCGRYSHTNISGWSTPAAGSIP